jgi:hypothetical protein
MHILHHEQLFVNTVRRLYNLPYFTSTTCRECYIEGQNSSSYIPLSVQKFGKLCGTSPALQHFPVTHTRSVLTCLTTNTSLVMHFASPPLFPGLPGGVNPISLPGYPSSSDLYTVHTISIFYFAQSFLHHFLPYFCILQSINFTPKTLRYRTHIF